MITDSLRVLLFGMAGIFIVMGILVLTLVLMNHFGRERRGEDENTDGTAE